MFNEQLIELDKIDDSDFDPPVILGKAYPCRWIDKNY
jgi:hypothetical protein